MIPSRCRRARRAVGGASRKPASSREGEALPWLRDVAQVEAPDWLQLLADGVGEFLRNQQRMAGEFGLLLEPAGEVDGGADDGENEAMGRAAIAVADIADMQGQPQMQGVPFFCAAPLVQFVHPRERPAPGPQCRL